MSALSSDWQLKHEHSPAANLASKLRKKGYYFYLVQVLEHQIRRDIKMTFIWHHEGQKTQSGEAKALYEVSLLKSRALRALGHPPGSTKTFKAFPPKSKTFVLSQKV